MGKHRKNPKKREKNTFVKNRMKNFNFGKTQENAGKTQENTRKHRKTRENTGKHGKTRLV